MEGIENISLKDVEIANKLNFRIKLLGISEIVGGKLFERVHPCLVNKDYMGNVNGVMNAVITEGEPVGKRVTRRGCRTRSHIICSCVVCYQYSGKY